MKNKISCLSLFLLVAFAAAAVSAQEYRKFEVFGGYAYANFDNVLDSIDDGIDPNISLRGINASATYNFHKYAGVKFDYSLTANRRTFTDPSVNLEVKYKNNQFLGGVQLKDNRDDASRFKPFAHVLVGMSNQRLNINGTVATTGGTGSVIGGGGITAIAQSFSTNNLAMVFGGGLDIKVHKNVDIRVVQFDFNPVFFGDQNIGGITVDGKTQNNTRLAFGVVFH